jgi:dolichol-phosphate mannosyltransferase
MSRATVDAVNALPEHHRVLRFVVPALGFPSTSVAYRREERAAGRSKYPLGKMIRLSLDSVTGFSTAPLRAATWLGLLGGLAALALLVYALIASISGHTLPGWTSTVVAVAGVGAVQLLCLGVLGEYVGRMYAHLQGRPSYYIAYDSLEVAPLTTDPLTPGGRTPGGRTPDPLTVGDGPAPAASPQAGTAPAGTAQPSRSPAARG